MLRTLPLLALIGWAMLYAAEPLAGARGAAADDRTISGPLVTTDRWPQATDLVSWTRDVIRIEGLENASETAQGKAFFEWLRLFCRMAVGGMIQAYEGGYDREAYVTDAHKNLFVYGWGYCDTCSRIAEAAWQEYKQDAHSAQRVITQHDDGGYHTMYRLRLDGRYGAFDPRYGYYVVDRDAPDARVLDWPEVGVDDNILRNREFKHRSRPFFEIRGVEWERALLLRPGWFESEAAWRNAGGPKETVFADSQHRIGTRFHDMDFRLPKGTTIERFWDNGARKFYVPAGKHTRREFPFLPSGRFYRVTEATLDGNWVKYDPNYRRAEPYVTVVPRDEGYPADLAGQRTIGQAWGRIRYEPNLTGGDVMTAFSAGATLVHATIAPYLRPSDPASGGEAVLDFYSPYILVDGLLEAQVAGGGVKLEIRTLKSKPAAETDPETWSAWQALPVSGGRVSVELGRPRFNGSDASVHGAYRFQVRVNVAPQAAATQARGLTAFRLRLDFENGIMSIPRILPGKNTVRFRLRDASRLTGPVQVVYRYRTATGERTHTQILRRADFQRNIATYTLDAPGLVRCTSLAVSY